MKSTNETEAVMSGDQEQKQDCLRENQVKVAKLVPEIPLFERFSIRDFKVSSSR
jgi:hypothetical protein